MHSEVRRGADSDANLYSRWGWGGGGGQAPRADGLDCGPRGVCGCDRGSPQELKQMIVGHSRSFPIDIAHHRAKHIEAAAGQRAGCAGGAGVLSTSVTISLPR